MATKRSFFLGNFEHTEVISEVAVTRFSKEAARARVLYSLGTSPLKSPKRAKVAHPVLTNTKKEEEEEERKKTCNKKRGKQNP